MRILSIKLKNINSLRGEFELDFTKPPLKDAGLFAMIGKMGSGKSTILDCITLALFNAIPRYSKVSKDAIEKGGLILTKNERDCYAEVKYSCKSGVYTSRWSISRTRNDTLRDYEMQVYGEGGMPLADKKTEVPQINAGLIGLNYDQFSKSILLSQGEFAKFLRSSKNERAQLLEEITATKDFRRLGRMAWIVYGRKKKEIDTKLELIKSLQATLMTDEDEATLKEQIELLEKDFTALTEASDKLKSRIESKRRLRQLELDIEKKKSNLETAKEAAAAFELTNAEKLSDYTRLLPHKKDIEEYGVQSAALEKTRKELGEAIEKEKTVNARISGLINELAQWVKTAVSEDDFFEQLDAFQGYADREVQPEAATYGGMQRIRFEDTEDAETGISYGRKSEYLRRRGRTTTLITKTAEENRRRGVFGSPNIWKGMDCGRSA